MPEKQARSKRMLHGMIGGALAGFLLLFFGPLLTNYAEYSGHAFGMGVTGALRRAARGNANEYYIEMFQ